MAKMQMPVQILNASTKRETGKKAQFANIAAAKARRHRSGGQRAGGSTPPGSAAGSFVAERYLSLLWVSCAPRAGGV